MICLDGCAPDYMRKSATPNIRSLCSQGRFERGNAMVPTVTNVNNVSLLTGVYPERHGITSNCYYDRERKTEVYMESAQDIRAVTIFEELRQGGKKTALLSVKDKLCTLLNRGADVVLSAENPPSWIVKEIGPPPSIYTIEVNAWLLRALGVVLAKQQPCFTYVATTDYVGHKYGPDAQEAHHHMELVDDEVGRIVARFPNLLVCIGADHGMTGKSRAVNLRLALEKTGIAAWVIPTVKDRYLPHHSNLSGSAYVFMRDRGEKRKALDLLRGLEGVERVLTESEAISEFHLPTKKVGEFLVLGLEDTVFGEAGEKVEVEMNIRSHGSLHEREVPLIVHGEGVDRLRITENKDLARVVLTWLRPN
jgi:phosphonoacetate hydrolase